MIKKLFKKNKIALVLGGGGARGISHLGVLKFLEEINFKYDFIVGTSAGAIFGALYLKYKNIDKVWNELTENIFKSKNITEELTKITYNNEKVTLLTNFKEKIYAAKVLFKEGILEDKFMREPYEILFKDIKNIEDLKGNIFMVATDLLSGKDVVFSKGEIIPALMATSAIPGIFPPVNYKGFYLIDGGSTQKLPTIIAKKLGADIIISIDVSGFLEKKVKKHPTGVKIMIRIEDIISYKLYEISSNFSNLTIKPKVNMYKWFEFDKYEEIFNAGYLAAKLKSSEIFKLKKLKTPSIEHDLFDDFILI